MHEEMHPVAMVVAVLTGLASAALSLWMTVIAFVGGTMPIIGLETEGGLVFGLFWLMIIEPIVLTVCYWISMLVAVPVGLIFRPRI